MGFSDDAVDEVPSGLNGIDQARVLAKKQRGVVRIARRAGDRDFGRHAGALLA
jgi:hypothetical protein